ncbi:MAG: amino acid/amide transporter substrate-binding protein family [Polaromonas sp.]|nr:amino acid/amide transporter substrate-binding protein family [Polaromonas sp.]
MPLPSSIHNRRRWLQRASALTAGGLLSPAGWAQPGKLAASTRRLTVAQLVDVSESQQDVSKDFLIGSRAAWQDINSRGGVRGQAVTHLALETNGTPASVRLGLDEALGNPACVVLSGSAGDLLASQVAALTRGQTIAHAAPWLQNSTLDLGDNTFPIFAARREQMGHAFKTLAVMGVKTLGAVYASSRDHAAHHEEVERIAASMQFQLKSYQAGADARILGQKLTADTPAILLFIGGTPELAQFTLGLEKQSRQRYIVALADVNLQTLMQMGAARNTPVIATQPVPMVNASLPVVRQYRDTLARLFDEPPTPHSLAGFIAARYTFDILNDIEAPLTRQNVLARFQKRSSVDVGGYRIAYNAQGQGSAYVTQSMMTLDGRLVG